MEPFRHNPVPLVGCHVPQRHHNSRNRHFPSATLNGRLPALTTLSIPDNFISDTIPQSLSACRRLRHLDLSQNTLVGTIPSSSPSSPHSATSTSPQQPLRRHPRSTQPHSSPPRVT
ncbi:hypothetical protein HN51_011296 [Arachis hypogaea]